LGSAAAGKVEAMTDSGGDPDQQLERTADELEEHLAQLDDHISDAQKAADARRADLDPEETVAGDWEDTRGDPGQGEDPKGAVDEGDASEGEGENGDTSGNEAVGGPTPGDAAGGDD
jgi:hypothetical protein